MMVCLDVLSKIKTLYKQIPNTNRDNNTNINTFSNKNLKNYPLTINNEYIKYNSSICMNIPLPPMYGTNNGSTSNDNSEKPSMNVVISNAQNSMNHTKTIQNRFRMSNKRHTFLLLSALLLSSQSNSKSISPLNLSNTNHFSAKTIITNIRLFCKESNCKSNLYNDFETESTKMSRLNPYAPTFVPHKPCILTYEKKYLEKE